MRFLGFRASGFRVLRFYGLGLEFGVSSLGFPVSRCLGFIGSLRGGGVKGRN